MCTKNRAYKFRIYPTKEQAVMFMKTFGCCRKIWNLMLADKVSRYQEDKTVLHNTPAMYKEDHPYLKEVDSLALANVQLHLQTAYKNFFTNPKTDFPKFKSRRRSRFSYTTNNQKDSVRITDHGRIRLPKVGMIKAVIHRNIPAGYRIKSATVSMERDGTFYCSLLCEYEADIKPVSDPFANAVGLDYKSDGFYVDSDGHTCGSPKYFRKAQRRLAVEQKRLSRKQGARKGERASRNFEKQRRHVAGIHRHIANQRKDFLHKTSTAIAKQYDAVCVETLNMKEMSNKDFGNGKATMDNGWGMFLNMLEYKLADRGKILMKVDKWFPSSQLCSCCGYRNHEVKDLTVREWICPVCGAVHDRDKNSSVNILGEGRRRYLAAMCG